MIEVILNIDHLIVYMGSLDNEKDEIQKVNEEIQQNFINKKIIFPIIPSVGMLVDLTKFYEGLSDNAKEWIGDSHGGNIRITEVIICNGYLELWFE